MAAAIVEAGVCGEAAEESADAPPPPAPPCAEPLPVGEREGEEECEGEDLR